MKLYTEGTATLWVDSGLPALYKAGLSIELEIEAFRSHQREDTFDCESRRLRQERHDERLR